MTLQPWVLEGTVSEKVRAEAAGLKREEGLDINSNSVKGVTAQAEGTADSLGVWGAVHYHRFKGK